MWKTEKLFGKAVMQKLNRESAICTRIETASTATGIPDLYVLARGIDYFIEFKNLPNRNIQSSLIKVPWRAGQQAFALNYREKFKTFKQVYYGEGDDEYIEGFVQKFSWTFVGCMNGVLLIPMYQVFNSNLVHFDDAVFKFTLDEFRKLDLLEFLRAHSQVFMPALYFPDPEKRICAIQHFWLGNMLYKSTDFLFDYMPASDMIAEDPALFTAKNCSQELLLKQYQAVANSMLEQYQVFKMNN